jgi:hypothetical protein
MRKLDIPTETWIERFGDWLDVHGLYGPNILPLARNGNPKQLKQWQKDAEELKKRIALAQPFCR